MSRTVNGELYFEDFEKEVLRKMVWQVADFCGMEVLTFCIMSNHFHVLVRVPEPSEISDVELLRRYRSLYPKPTKYQSASVATLETQLARGGDEAGALRRKLLARMGDISEYMKMLKQRFSVWYNRTHQRFGTLWAERFKSVLVEGKGNPLQTMAAYIDLNPVRAGLVEDPKDYRFCGYAEAVAGASRARDGLRSVWLAYGKDSLQHMPASARALQCHRELIFGKRAADSGLPITSREKALKILEAGHAILPRTTVLRCRVRYFTDGAILGSQAYVRGFLNIWQMEKGRKRPPKVHILRGADWSSSEQDEVQQLACIKGLRKAVFG